jgi:signal transduction histidine kinase/CheY-like chemotaxis protein
MGIFQRIQHKISSSLELRVIVIFSGVITAFWLTFILINSIIIYSENFKELITKGDGLTKRLAGMVIKDMQYFDYVKLESQLKNYFIEEELLYAAIFNSSGEVVALNIKQKNIDERKITDNAFRNSDKQVKHITKRVNNSSLLFAYPIIDENGDLWGYVNILLSLNLIKHKLLIRLIIFILSALLAFIIEITILKRLTHKIVSPTSKLIDLAHRIAKTQDLSLLEQTRIPAKGELVLLFEALKKMLLDIKKYQDHATRTANLVAIGESTAMVAHDVRKPLTSMKALLSALPTIKDDPVQVKKMIADVDRNIANTNAMLNDILDFSRDSTALDLKEHNLQSIATSALGDALRNHPDADVKIEYNFDHGNTSLYADGGRITRVLTNIIDNALGAMTVNGSDKANGALLFRTSLISKDGKKQIGISVADSGPGIPEEVFPKMFDAFFTKGKKGGTGLGLAICQKIIMMHGGKIEAKNCTTGAEFVIELLAGKEKMIFNEAELIHHSSELKAFRKEEAARTDYGDTANTQEFMRINKERGRISNLLIVDDEPLFRESVRCVLSAFDQVKDHVKFIEAGSAEVGLDLFKATEFDYLIADIDLGKNRLNGYDFARSILEKYPNVQVLIHSNKRKDELDKNIRQIASERFMGFLPKPMKASELLQFLACKTFETPNPPSPPLGKGGFKKVLLLNDDKNFNLTMKMMLKGDGIQVLDATNISDAIKHLADGKNKCDAILSDINLGENEPNGYDFLKQVREQNNQIPFIFVSGYSEKEEWPKAENLGATGYIQLPFEPEKFKEMLKWNI